MSENGDQKMRIKVQSKKSQIILALLLIKDYFFLNLMSSPKKSVDVVVAYEP